jgi:antitoxin (DNA-binding transcriptional repressor) of toxin-antitoxin stability system
MKHDLEVYFMQFITTRELRNSPQIWERLSQNEDIVVTNNGKPAAFLIGIPDGQFEFVFDGIRKAKAKLPLSDPAERVAAWQAFFDAMDSSPDEPLPEFERLNFKEMLDL